jgi:hypothetical protein
MAGLDAKRILRLFSELGQRLARPTTLCLIGSTPAIASGQPGRQTADIDLWHDGSDYDTGDLARACRELGVAFDPHGELEPDAIYIQVVRPGIVRLPAGCPVEVVGQFGNLTVVMPKPEILVAAKLVRASETDIQDIAWWVHQRSLKIGDIEAAIEALPNHRDREVASENMTFVRLTRGRA